jgi:uncharacterized protein YjeT (DUF2065 family)
VALPLLLLAQLATCFLLVLVLLELLLDPEQWRNQRSDLLLMMYLNVTD